MLAPVYLLIGSNKKYWNFGSWTDKADDACEFPCYAYTLDFMKEVAMRLNEKLGEIKMTHIVRIEIHDVPSEDVPLPGQPNDPSDN